MLLYKGTLHHNLEYPPVLSSTLASILPSSSSIPSTLTPAVITSPGTTFPTPFGVPVSTRSSSSSANTPLTCCKILGILNSIKPVLSSCRTFPLTSKCKRTLCGSGILFLGMKCDTGRKVLKPLASDHGRPFLRAACCPGVANRLLKFHTIMGESK